MSRQSPLPGIVMAVALIALSGCHPQQPFYFFEDGDLSHYKGVATEIEYPDVQSQTLAEAEGAERPFTLDKDHQFSPDKPGQQLADLTLEQAVRIALANNKVMRAVGGNVSGPPDVVARNPELVPTIWDPAIAESDPRAGVEAALSAFDTQFHSVVQWQNFHEPRNVQGAGAFFVPQIRNDDNGTFQNQLRKTAATGATFALSHDLLYTNSPNTLTRIYPSDWTTQLRAELRQPLLQGSGVQFNRIAGPGAVPGVYNGVMIARINTDVSLTNLEIAVRNLVLDVETAYWELYYAYRNLATMKDGRDAALAAWQQANNLRQAGTYSDLPDAQARQAYYEFRTAMERALVDLYQAESKLRYELGLATTDGRLFRPSDGPTTAKIDYDWNQVLAEALARNTELHQNRWLVKRQELELIAAKNYLLPKADLMAMYQWQGLGNRLLDSSGGTGDFTLPGSNSYQNLTSAGFADWMLGVEVTVPIGFRREMSGVRNAQLALARQRARLQESELEVTHQLAFALREMESNLILTKTNLNRRVAAKKEVELAQNLVEVRGRSPEAKPSAGERAPTTLTDLLDAQRRKAVADTAYYRTLVNYVEAIAQVHYRKGSLLEYNGVYLAEGPWPAKAYFDAERRARARDAAMYLDYGFTQPKVLSRGPIEHHADSAPLPLEVETETGVPNKAGEAAEPQPEQLPVPEPMTVPTEPPPKPQDNQQTTRAAPRGAQVAENWSAARQAARSQATRPFDVGALDLRSLAGKASGGPVAQPGQPPAASPAAYEEPLARTKTNNPGNSTTKSSRIKWVDAAGTESLHEPVANPPPAEPDRPAASWQRVER